MTGGMESFTVSELSQIIAESIRRDPRTRSVAVRGEVSGFKHHIPSGHWYFSLKDAGASLRCVMFRSNTARARVMPRDGDSVVVSGYIDVYPRDGTYQLYAQALRPAGLGDQYLALEQLKRKLTAEGLFDPARKRPLPMLPAKVAVVTSESGAALHDILNVSRLRSPFIPIVLVPVTVQGAGAGEEIARGVTRAGTLPGVEVIIVGRGGGSPEDLWCFNDEAVARAVAASPVPVVSGVGHEVDTTLCDFAADVRASTPSNAAEIVFPDRRELMQRTGLLRLGLEKALRREIRDRELILSRTRERLTALSPEKRLAELKRQAAFLRESLAGSMRRRLEERAAAAGMLRLRLDSAIARRADGAAGALNTARQRLEAISPLRVLGRGYALVYEDAPEEASGRLLKTAAEAGRVRDLRLRFADGQIRAERKDGEHGESEL